LKKLVSLVLFRADDQGRPIGRELTAKLYYAVKKACLIGSLSCRWSRL